MTESLGDMKVCLRNNSIWRKVIMVSFLYNIILIVDIRITPLLGGDVNISLENPLQSEFLIDTNLTNEPDSPYIQYYPSVAFDGTNYLVVWTDYVSLDSVAHICGARVSPSGVVLDPNQILISTTAKWPPPYYPPAVAFDGSNYFVVWADVRDPSNIDIYGARVTPSGVVLDPNGIRISSAPYREEEPSIAFGGGNYLVVWNYWIAYGYESRIYGARVTPDGVVLDPGGIPISMAATYRFRPSVAFDGTNYLVVWDDARNTYGHYCDIYAARVTPSGSVLDPGGILISGITNGYNDVSSSVAFDGTNYMVVWQSRPGSGVPFIFSARVSPNGTVIDTNHYNYELIGREPKIAFNGSEYVVTYTFPVYYNNDDIYGLHINTSGNIIDTFLVSNQDRLQFQSALAHGTYNQVLITYSGWTDYINNQPVNRQRIWGKLLPQIAIKENEKFTYSNIPFQVQVYPNPFMDKTNIRLQISEIGNDKGIFNDIDAQIFDVNSGLIKRFTFTQQTQHFAWSGLDHKGKPLAPGIYFITLRLKNRILLTKKIIKLGSTMRAKL